METLSVLFLRNPVLVSPIIRAFTWSAWCHCSIIDRKTDTVLEAIGFSGVRERPLPSAIADASKYEIVEVEVPDLEAALAWARSQLGKPYDYMGVLGLGLHRDWMSDDKWWCSEYVEAAIVAGGRRRFRNPRRVTPQDVYNVV